MITAGNTCRYWIRHHLPIAKKVYQWEPNATWILREAKKIIDQRVQIGQTNRTDLLQLMLESASDEDFIHVRRSYFLLSEK